jgi:hypothetical protein
MMTKDSSAVSEQKKLATHAKTCAVIDGEL